MKYYMNVSLCNVTDISCCVNHLFEVPQRSMAVLAGYCKPAGRCCRTWGHQHLSLSPVSPKYLKSTGTQTRQTSGRSLLAPAPHLKTVSRSIVVAVAEHHLTATCWNKKCTPVSAGRAISPHFSIVAQKYPLSTDFSWWKYSISQLHRLLLPWHWWNLTHQIIWN